MYGWLQYKKAVIRGEVKTMMLNELTEDALEVLTFTSDEAANLKWEHAVEFEFDGRMYDVVEKRQNGESITYVCWPDHKESDLNKQLDELARNANQSDQDQNNGTQRLLSFFKTFYSTDSKEPLVNGFPLKSKAIEGISSLFDTIYREIDSPPPQHT
jgi:hypothetical protein